MSRPGSVVVLRGGLPVPPEPLVPAAYALLLGLVDGDSPVWLDGDYPDASRSIRFHTGARIVADLRQAAFAVVSRAAGLLPLERFAQGSHDYPDRSCTVILQVDHLAAGAGLKLRGPGIARHGHAVHRPGETAAIGTVTSGSHSPTLERAIAMAYVPPDAASAGTMLEIAIREARVAASLVDLPFYRRARP